MRVAAYRRRARTPARNSNVEKCLDLRQEKEGSDGSGIGLLEERVDKTKAGKEEREEGESNRNVNEETRVA